MERVKAGEDGETLAKEHLDKMVGASVLTDVSRSGFNSIIDEGADSITFTPFNTYTMNDPDIASTIVTTINYEAFNLWW